MITVTGNFESLTGIGNGYAVFTLINYGTGNIPRLSGTGVIVNPSLTTLAATSFSVQLWGNDAITPANTYYQVSFYDTANHLISSATYQFNGSGSYDLSQTSPVVVTPTQPLGLAAVAYSGSYNDLGNTPSIPALNNPNTWTATQTFNTTIGLGSSNVLQISSDTGISRGAAGQVNVGNGTAGDASGTLNVANLYTSSLRPQSTLLTYTYADLGSNRNLIPLALGQWADRFQFATITALETSTNGSTWSDWSAQINNAKVLLSGYYNNAGFSINPTTYPYWRMTLNPGQFSYSAMLELVQEYSTGGTKPFTVTLETSSDGASWSNVIGPTSVSAANPDYAHLFFAGQTANSYFRVTIQHTSTTSNYNWKAIRLRSTRTNGQGGPVQGLPFSWDASGSLKMIVNNASIQLSGTTGVLQLSTDTGISRSVAGQINVGNGTTGDASGYVNAAGYKVGGTALAASHLSNGTTGSGLIVLAASPSITGTATFGGNSVAASLLVDNASNTATIGLYGSTGTVSAVIVDSGSYKVSGTALAASHLSNGTTGSGSVVLATSPTLSGTVTAPTVNATTGFQVNGAALNFTHLAGTWTMSDIPSGGSSSTFLRGDGTWAAPTRTASINYVIDGGGSVPSTGAKGQISIPVACTITGWVLTGDVSGSAVVDVLRSTYAGFPTTSSIAGTDKPTLSSVQKNQNLAISAWGSTSLAAGDQLQVNLSSVSSCTRLNLTLIVTI